MNRRSLLALKLGAYVHIGRNQGLRTLGRIMVRNLESAVAARGPRFALWSARAWHALWITLGAALCVLAPRPAMSGAAPELARMVAFIAVSGLGAAIALRGLAMLLASFSGPMLVQGFNVSIVPALVRGAGVMVVAATAVALPWPLAGWTAAAVAGVLWMVWPLVGNAVLASRGAVHMRHRSVIRDMLALHARTVPADVRRRMAVHEAGHALFFGLGSSIAQDLFAYLEDEVPSTKDIARLGGAVVGGAVGSLTQLAAHWNAPTVGRGQMTMLLGFMCGGAAAERVVYGEDSIAQVMDAGMFEEKARLFLAAFPDPGFPYFAVPASDDETASNARSIAMLRERVGAQATAFLDAHRDVLLEVAGALEQAGELGSDELEPMLRRVRPLAGFERFDWGAGVPVHEVPAPVQQIRAPISP